MRSFDGHHHRRLPMCSKQQAAMVHRATCYTQISCNQHASLAVFPVTLQDLRLPHRFRLLLSAGTGSGTQDRPARRIRNKPKVC